MSGVILDYYFGFSVCALEGICQLKFNILLTRLIFIVSYLKFLREKNILDLKKYILGIRKYFFLRVTCLEFTQLLNAMI